MSTSLFNNLLSRLAANFDFYLIPYMIIGGQAVLLYGEPRFTRDIDITLGVDTDRIQDILKIVQSLQLQILPEDVHAFVQKTKVLPAQESDSGIRIDLIFSNSPYEQQAIQRARTIHIENADVRFASPEDLIIHKIFAGRPRDLEDVRGVLLKNPSINQRYILKWLSEFDQALETSFLDTFEQLILSVKNQE